MSFSSLTPALARILCGLAALLFACLAVAAEAVKKQFDLPADIAARSLKAFAHQSGVEVLIRAELGREIQTQPVKGEMTSRQAIDAMLRNTGLVAEVDEKNGVFAIRREGESEKNAQRVAPAATSGHPARKEPATLAGTVTNVATGRTLEGVRVVLQGSGRETFTDSQGSYRFSGVEPGDVVLGFSYTGPNPQETSVAVEPGRIIHKDIGLTADIYQMNRYVVSGEREGNAQAVTLQRLSAGVKNVVSADAFGSLAGNPADLLVRLPGITGVAFEGDMRYIQVRGMSENLTTVTMDGNRLADGAEASTSRQFQFQTVGSVALERIEVVKSPTPDMHADSIAGAVNLVTKSAFDSSPERRIGATFGATWRPFDPRETRAPRNYALSYSEVFSGRFAVALNASYRVHDAYLDSGTQTREQLPAGSQGPAYTQNFSYDDFRMERARSNVALKLDYKLSDTVRFYASATYNKHVEHENTFRPTWTTTAAVAIVNPDGTFSGTGGILPGYTEHMTAIRPVAGSLVSVKSDNLYQIGKSLNFAGGGVHRYEKTDLDYNIYKSNAKVDFPGNKDMVYTMRNVGFTIVRDDDPYFPTVTQTAGPDIRNLNNYTENAYTHNERSGWDGFWGASLNARRKFDAAAPFFLKAGVNVRDQTRKVENRSWRTAYVGPDGVMGPNPATGLNDDNLLQFGQVGLKRHRDLAKYPALPFPPAPGRGNDSIEEAHARTPHYFVDQVATNTMNPLAGNQKFAENILGYYLMGNVDLGRLSILGGLRIEHTSVDAEGALQTITPEEAARRAAWVGPVTDAEIRRRTIAEYSGRKKASGDTRDVFPGIHFKYSPRPNIVTRLSYATNIGRPSIGQLIPATNVSDNNRTVSTSNPSLKPQYAHNFDLMGEYYFEPAGLFSIGVFHKELDRFIYTSGGATIGQGQDNGFDGNYAGYTLTTQYNGGQAQVQGLEVNYSQQFRFLPGFWSGFGAFANFTKLKIKGHYGTGSSIALMPANLLPNAPTNEVAGFKPITANAGISYIRNRISLRLQVNHVGRYLATFNANQSRLQYAPDRTAFDVKTLYRLNRHFEFYFDVNNIFNAPDSEREYYGGRPRSIGIMSPQLLFGVHARM